MLCSGRSCRMICASACALALVVDVPVFEYVCTLGFAAGDAGFGLMVT